MAITPDVVKQLRASGHHVALEADAGREAGFGDHDYREAGATTETGAEQVWNSELVLGIRPDWAGRELKEATTIVGLLRPFDEPRRMRELAATGAAALAFEALPRTTRAQAMDVLSSQATVAGYQAVLEAATRLSKFFPMLTTAAGTVPPARVLVLGAGVAGLQAIATARRLGARVSAFDVRAAAAEQVESLGAHFVTTEAEPQDAATAGGYARELAEEAQARLLENLAPHVAEADVVISTAQIPGKPAPRLVTRAMVESMHPGSVIVDLAASTGGNCELTRVDEEIVEGGVVILGPTDLESRNPTDASRMYARNAAALISHLAGDEGELWLREDDEIIQGCLIAQRGRVVHPRVLELLEA